MVKFILPEKWCIKVTKENSTIVGEVFGKISRSYIDWYNHNSDTYRIRPYLKSLNDNGSSYINPSSISSFSSSICPPEYLELTTEEFIEHVLNKQNVDNQFKYDPDLEIIYKRLLNL